MTRFTSMRVRLVLDILRESKTINDLKISLFTLCIFTSVQVNKCHIRTDFVLPYWQFRTFNIGLRRTSIIIFCVVFQYFCSRKYSMCNTLKSHYSSPVKIMQETQKEISRGWYKLRFMWKRNNILKDDLEHVTLNASVQ